MGQPAKAKPSFTRLKKEAPTLEDRTAGRIAEDFTHIPAQEIFARLLWTWPLHLERSRDRTALLGDVGNQAWLRERYQQLEDSYGDRDSHDQSTCPDRRLLLWGAVARLKRHAEEHEKPVLLQTVFTVLLQARDKAIKASLDRFKLLADRESRVEPDLATSRHLVDSLRARQQHLLHSDPFARIFSSQSLVLINELLALEDTPSSATPKLPQGRAANMPAAWARKALAEACVPQSLPGFHQILSKSGCNKRPKNLHEAFLMAVGLVAYGSPRITAP